MLRRIELILKTQNLTPTQFADKLGIQRSGLSHILAGRNNPSLDFVTKVLNVFPEIQTDWLLLGKGSMYFTHSSTSSNGENLSHSTEIKEEKITFYGDENSEHENSVYKNEIQVQEKEKTHPYIQEIEVEKYGREIKLELPIVDTPSQNRDFSKENIRNTKENPSSEVEKIVIFYKNGRFKVYEGGF